MANFEIKSEEVAWLAENYPRLIFDRKLNIISGFLDFGAVYCPDTNSCRVYPFVVGRESDNNLIYDSFKIKIAFIYSRKSELPSVYETGGRIKQGADRHCNDDKSFCLCSRLIEKRFLNPFCLRKFIADLVVPFFYAQRYFDKNGQWPWGEFGHYDIGLIESFAEYYSELTEIEKINATGSIRHSLALDYLRKQKTSKDVKCICGSGKRMRRCHKSVLTGLRLMQKYFDINDKAPQNDFSRIEQFNLKSDCVVIDKSKIYKTQEEIWKNKIGQGS
jgi:hypothetical protein